MAKLLLVVNDNEIDRLELKKILCNNYDIIERTSITAATAEIFHSYKSLAAILIDASLPDHDALNLLRHINNNPLMSQIPVLVTAPDNSAETEMMELGAQGVITKPYDCCNLELRLANLIRLHENSALVNSFRKDKLTGLLSQGAFFSEAVRLINMHDAGFYVFSTIDIEKFSVINDLYGSSKGDKLLKEVAMQLQKLIDSVGGVCARINADNFALVYPKEKMDSALIAQTHHAITMCDTSIPPIRFSIGRYVIEDVTIPVTAMYDRAVMAKASVKGHFEHHIAFYTEYMRENVLRTQKITDEMRPALENMEFVVWFQPQYNHVTGSLIGAEALARWKHPSRGMIPPAEFIPVFEQNGFIYELDKFIWRSACMYIRKQLDKNCDVLPISVNISRYDVFCKDLITVLTDLIKEYEIPIELLRLEITESAFADDIEQIINVVKMLVDLGFTVEIDDFGSGYSSLNTLKDVPAQIVKLDMRFLEGKDNLDRGGSIIESIIRMARWLGMSVIAEGVETAEQANFLKSIGCCYIQGFFYGRPMPEEEYTALVKNENTEKKFISLQTVKNLDNNSFWNPKSMDTLIFNSYVGSACILEFSKGKITLLRSTDAYTKLLAGIGLSLDDAMKLDWGLHMGKAQLNAFTEAITKSIESKEGVINEYEFSHLPGCPKKVYLRNTQRVIAITGDRCMIYSLTEDMTAQREAEQRERELTVQLKAIMANISGGISAAIMQDGKTKYLFANEQFYSLLGYTKEQFEAELPNGLRDALYAEDKQRAEAKYFEYIVSGKTSAINEFRVRKRDGSLIWLHASGSVCHLDGVKQSVNIAVYTDITDEKKNAQKISNAEQIQTIISNINAGVAAMNVSLGMPQYIFFNDQYCAMFGYTRAQFEAELPNGLRDIILPEYEPDVMAAAVCAEKSGELSVIEFPVRCRSGIILWVRSNTSICHLNGFDHAVHIVILTDITSERMAQQRGLALNEDLQTMMADMPGGFLRFKYMPDAGDLVLYANNGFCKLVGMTLAEVNEKYSNDPLCCVHPDDRALVADTLARIKTTGEVSKMHYRRLHKNGNYIWVSVFVRISKNRAGVHYCNLYYSEPTEAEKKDLSIREAMPFLFTALMDSTTDIVFAKDKELRYIYGSPAFFHYVGCHGVNEIIGKTDAELFPSETAAEYNSVDKELIASGTAIIDRIEPISSEDNILHYVCISKYLVRDSAGEILAIFGIGRDITDIKQSYNRLSLLTDSMPGGIASYVVSGDNISITYYNDTFCKMLGCTRAEYEKISKKSVIGQVFPSDLPRLLAQLDDLLKNGTDVDCVYRSYKFDGSGYVWINLRGTLSERKKDSVYITAVLYDVTARQEAEQKILAANEKLRLLNDIAHEVLSQPDIDDGIHSMLHKILVHFCGARAYVFEKDASGLTTSNTYEVCAPGVTSEIHHLQNIPNETMSAWYSVFDDGCCINIADVDSIDESRAEERKILKDQNIRSLVAVPFMRNNRICGFIGVDDPIEHIGSMEQLRAIGDYISIMLMRRDGTMF